MATGSVDYYGFPKETQYRRKADYPIIRSSVSTQQVIITSVLIFIVLIWATMAIGAGYHAYFEYPNDPTWLRNSRVYTAVLFAPFYLFYVFMKNTVFKVE